MKTDFYEIACEGMTTARIAIQSDTDEAKSYQDVEKLAFKVAQTRFVLEGGFEGKECKVVDLMPAGIEIPKDAITKGDVPGVFVWFLK